MSLASRVAEWVTALKPLFWPVLVLGALLYLGRSGLLAGLIGRIRKVSGAGLDFECHARALAQGQAPASRAMSSRAPQHAIERGSARESVLTDPAAGALGPPWRRC